MNEASSDRRNRQALAMSSDGADPAERHAGRGPAPHLGIALCQRACMGYSVALGRMTLERILSLANWIAIDLESARMPALET